MWKLLACFLVLAAVDVQAASLTIVAPPPQYGTSAAPSWDVNTWTDYFFASATEQPTSEVTFTFTLSAGLESSISSFTLTAANWLSFSFKFKAAAPAQDYVYNITTPSAQFPGVISGKLSFEKRKISFPKWSSGTFRYPAGVNLPSEPIEVVLSTPSVSSLLLTALPNTSSVQFNPNPLTIPSGARSAFFTFQSSVPILSDSIQWTIAGDEAGSYEELKFQKYPLLVEFRDITVNSPVDLFPSVVVSQSLNTGIYAYIKPGFTNGLTITPQAADTTFTPTSFTFDSDNSQLALFNFTTTTPTTIDGKTVYFFATDASGNFNYSLIQSFKITPPKRKVLAKVSNTLVITNTTYLSLTITAPVAESLTVSFFASNVRFNVSSVTFSGTTTSLVVALTAVALGPDTINFQLSGKDYDNLIFEKIPDLVITGEIVEGNFIGPASWYIPTLLVGKESDKIPVRASISPINSVSLTPSAPNLLFNPPQLTFRNGSEQQYFTITPLYPAKTDTTYKTTLNWFVTGEDSDNFVPPTSLTITVNVRFAQIVWSSHLNTDNVNRYDGGVQDTRTNTYRYLGKTYKVWASLNFVGEHDQVSITPVSSFFSFEPSTLYFDAKHTRILFEATVTGVAPGGATEIAYHIGGKDGGLYAPYDSEYWITSLRPLKIVAAVVSPDERNQGVFLATTFNPKTGEVNQTFNPNTILTANHVHSFLLRSFVLPNEELTITPRSPHVKFSPSKITIKNKDAVPRIDWHTSLDGLGTVYYFNHTGLYLEANFSVEGEAAGIHDVWFELTGEDAQYYFRPNHQLLKFSLVTRPSSEPFNVSPSSFLFPSFVVVALMAAISLVM